MRPHIVTWLAGFVPSSVAGLIAPTWFTCVGIAGVVTLFVMLAVARRHRLDAGVIASMVLWCYVAAVAAGIVVPMMIDAFEQAAMHGHVRWRWAGMTSFWGYLAGLGAVAAVCKLHDLRLARLGDLAAAPLGGALFFARLGCFVAGCDYGKVTALPWAVRFPAGSPAWHDHVDAGLVPASRGESLPVHPTELYEAVLGLVIIAVSIALARRAWARRGDGRVFVVAAATYAAGRIAVESCRGDAGRGIYAGLSSGQIFSLLLLAVIVGGVLIRRVQRHRARLAGGLAAAACALVIAIAAPHAAHAQAAVGPAHAQAPAGPAHAQAAVGPAALSSSTAPNGGAASSSSTPPIGLSAPSSSPASIGLSAPSSSAAAVRLAARSPSAASALPGAPSSSAAPNGPAASSSSTAPIGLAASSASIVTNGPATSSATVRLAARSPSAASAHPAAPSSSAPPIGRAASPSRGTPIGTAAPSSSAAPIGPAAPPAPGPAPGPAPADAVYGPVYGPQLPPPPPPPPTVPAAAPIVVAPAAEAPAAPSTTAIHVGGLFGVAVPINRRADQVQTLAGGTLSAGVTVRELGAWLDFDSFANRDATHGTVLLSGGFMAPVSDQLRIGGRIGAGWTLVNFKDTVFRDVSGATVRFEGAIEYQVSHAWALWARPLSFDFLSASALGGPIFTWQLRLGAAYTFWLGGGGSAPRRAPSIAPPPGPPPGPPIAPPGGGFGLVPSSSARVP